MSKTPDRPEGVPQNDWGTKTQVWEPPYYENPHLPPDSQQPIEPPFYEPEPPPPSRSEEKE